jgi:hypothetical protein
MTTLPFRTYQEATEYFGIKIPRHFYNSLVTIDNFCQKNELDTLDELFNAFGLLRIEGNEARYQQTPIEMFPFASTGSDGTHYGFIIHTTDEEDYPSGEICPMDSDGVVLISNSSETLLQKIIWDDEINTNLLPVLNELNLDISAVDRNRYDDFGNLVRVSLNPKSGWQFLNTSDGAGVFAEEKFFNSLHITEYDYHNQQNGIERYERLADEMHKKGLFASQLFYLKELYWNEWTNYELAKKYLTQMLIPYEKLNRQHLYNTTKWALDNFNSRYIA